MTPILRTDLDSDTERWDDLISRLQTFKECVSRHHSKLVAVIVSEEMKDLSPDITSTLKLRFGLDDKSLLSLLAINVDPNDSTAIQLANNELKTIGHAILENAWIVHQEHAQRIIQEATKRLQTPTQRNVLDNCKVESFPFCEKCFFSWDFWRSFSRIGQRQLPNMALPIDTFWIYFELKTSKLRFFSKEFKRGAL